MNEYNVHIPEHRLVVMPIRKAACSSIKETLKEHYPRQKMRIVDNPEVAELRAAGEVDVIASWTRHPLARLVSFHEHLIRRKGRPEMGWYEPLDRFGLYRDMPFAEMVECIADVADSDADPHFRSQWALLTHGDELLPTWVGRVESMVEDWGAFCGMVPRLELPDLPQHRNTSDHPPWSEYYTDPMVRGTAASRYARDLATWYRRS